MKKIIVIISLIIFSACASKKLSTSKENDKPKEKETAAVVAATPEEINAGKANYGQYCGTCHKLYDIESESESEWRKIIPRMSKKANIDSKTEETILKYVVAIKQTKK